MWSNFLRKIVQFLDPKLEKYRQKKPEKKYTPKSLEEFIDVIRRTPTKILSTKDRARISAIMNFETRTVNDLMIPKSKIVFVKNKEILGPLVLDKLYKSGFTNFPVINAKEKIIGVIHTEALNALEIKKTDLAEKYLDPHVYYLHTSDSLQKVINEIERTNSYFFLVLDDSENLVGFFTIEQLLDYFLQS